MEFKLNPNYADEKTKTKISNNIQGTLTKLETLTKSSKGIKWEEFSSEDKFNLITLFVCNRIVLMEFYRLLFPENAERMDIISNEYMNENQTNNSKLLNELHNILNSTIENSPINNTKCYTRNNEK